MPALLNRAPELRETSFRNERLARLGIEVMSLDSLRRRVPARTMARPERVEFLMLLLVTRGLSAHMVEFASFPIQVGSLVFVQPGQVQQWQPLAGLEGLLLLVDPPVMNPDTTRSALQHTLAREWPEWPGHTVLRAGARPAVQQWFENLATECAAFDGSELSIALMRSMLGCLLLYLARMHHRTPTPGCEAPDSAVALVRQLRSAIDARLRARPAVQTLASDLGYSVSTLNRACLAVEGRSAKAAIDHRVAMEARRLLVHTTDAASQIGLSLGFSEPTNFVKFFKRVVGCTPEVFRRRYVGAT